MKNFYLSLKVSFVLIIALLLNSCKDTVVKTVTYRTQTPYYISVSNLRAMTVAQQAPQDLNIPGKIYIYGDYLFINDVNKGIHVIDNSHPSSPRFINFINIPGNVDMAVNNNILYADSYTDLLSFDISNPTDIKLINRVEDVFEKYYIDKTKGLIAGYKDTVITYSYDETINKGWYIDDRFISFANSGAQQSYGTGGSMAKFTLMNNSLYTIDNQNLKVFNVADAKAPTFTTKLTIGFGIETIFPYNEKLFIGSTTGMHIYDASNASAPTKLSTYRHVTSCDPVVVEGDYAYVTLRSANFCQQGVNLLEVLNIADPTNPKLIASFPMINPHGLTLNNQQLFICEGQSGLKVFSKTDPLKIGENQLFFFKNINAVDVIAGPKSLIITGSDGIYQLDYSQPKALKLLSSVSLKPVL